MCLFHSRVKHVALKRRTCLKEKQGGKRWDHSEQAGTSSKYLEQARINQSKVELAKANIRVMTIIFTGSFKAKGCGMIF